jgi:ATP-dependent HslUV protease, peptidase subunit HslV
MKSRTSAAVSSASMEKWHSTTVVCVRHSGKVAMASDGQVTLGNTIMKQTAAKIRRLKGGEVLAGFAGSSADAFALFSRFEAKLDEHRGNLERSAIELAKEWRTDKMLRQLEALLVVADKQSSLLVSGTGDLISPEEGVLAIGSGGAFALAAARALLKHRPELTAAQIAKEALLIASQIDIYTNDRITLEEL